MEGGSGAAGFPEGAEFFEGLFLLSCGGGVGLDFGEGCGQQLVFFGTEGGADVQVGLHLLFLCDFGLVGFPVRQPEEDEVGQSCEDGGELLLGHSFPLSCLPRPTTVVGLACTPGFAGAEARPTTTHRIKRRLWWSWAGGLFGDRLGDSETGPDEGGLEQLVLLLPEDGADSGSSRHFQGLLFGFRHRLATGQAADDVEDEVFGDGLHGFLEHSVSPLLAGVGRSRPPRPSLPPDATFYHQDPPRLIPPQSGGTGLRSAATPTGAGT